MVTSTETMTCGVAVQLPNFNREDPVNWFHITEANFHLRGVTDSMTKYCYVMSKLDAEGLRQISAFLAQARGKDPYGELKLELCRAFETTPQQRLDTWLSSSDLGDQRPTSYLRELDRLSAGLGFQDVRRCIFLRSLPRTMVNAITANPTDSVEGLGQAADRVWSQSARPDQATVSVVAAATTNPPATPVNHGEAPQAVVAAARQQQPQQGWPGSNRGQGARQ